MSSPSGFDTAVRGVVMLGVLGGGVWGASHYPPVWNRVQATWRQWETGTLLRSTHDGVAQARLEAGDAPAFDAPLSSSSIPSPPFPSASLPPSAAPPPQYSAAEFAPPHSAPPSSTLPPLAVPPQALPPQTLATDDTTRPLPRRPLSEPMQAAARDNPASLYGAQQVDFRRDETDSRAPTSSSPSLAELDTRLSQLGATYCLLERWQENPPRYRFHCRVQLSAGAEPRRFEANGADPALLMQQVADTVAACRAQLGAQPPSAITTIPERVAQ